MVYLQIGRDSERHELKTSSALTTAKVSPYLWQAA